MYDTTPPEPETTDSATALADAITAVELHAATLNGLRRALIAGGFTRQVAEYHTILLVQACGATTGGAA